MNRKSVEMESNSDQMTANGFMNTINTKLNELKQFSSQMDFENNQLKSEVNRLKHEKSELLSELDALQNENNVLQNEIMSVKEDRDVIHKELREVRNENDLLIKKLEKMGSLDQTVVEFAKNVLQLNNMNGIEQMVLTERPNSMTAFGSFGDDFNGMRLRQSESKEETYHSTRMPSAQTSDENYYDAIGSHRSSLTNGTTGVRPKVQQNQVSSSVSPSMPTTTSPPEVLNETLITGVTDSTNFYIDENNNLKLKLVKPPIGRLISVSVAYLSSPSELWLHIKPEEVNDYLHVIQVKQMQLSQLPNCSLSAADIHLGMYCAAIYSADGYWYRAQIIDITYDHPIERDSIKSVLVLFIDWGNTEERPLSKIMRISHELTKRRQALRCYIQGCGHVTVWPKKDRKEFSNILKDEKLNATFNKCHQINEVLDSVVYPIDLTIESENGVIKNVVNFLTIPEIPEEPIEVMEAMALQLSLSINKSKEKSADTVKCSARLNGHSNPTISATKSVSDPKKIDSKRLNFNESKSQSNQNCSTNSNKLQEMPKPVPKSSPHLNGLQQSQQNLTNILRIPPPIVPEVGPFDALLVEASHPVSPSYLYLHIRDINVGNAQFEDLDDQLNAYYANYKPSSPTLPAQVTVDSFWVTIFSGDNRWYRCRVTEMDSNRVLVNYVDWGNEEWVDIKNLMQLTRQFAVYPAMAVKSRLANIFPKEPDGWTDDAIEFFGKLIIDRPLTAYIREKDSNFGFDSFISVFLWVNDDSNDQNVDILINWQLVVNSFAESNNPELIRSVESHLREKTPPKLMSELIPTNNVNNCQPINSSTIITKVMNSSPVNEYQPSIETKLTNGWGTSSQHNKSVNKAKILPELANDEFSDDSEWDPMGDAAACDLNNYNIRPNDAGIATVGFRPEDRRTCKFYGTAKGCRLDNYCSFPHMDPDKRFELNDTEREFTDIPEIELKADSIICLKVTSVLSPNLFYGVLPFGTKDITTIETTESEELTQDKDLKTICSSLKNFYSKPQNIKENRNIYPGISSLVAYRDDRTDTYFRGRVIDYNSDTKVCTIFNVDLGIELEINRNSVFKLGTYWTETPAQAIECSVVGIIPINNVQWTEQSIEKFSEWILNKTIITHIMYGKTEGKYYVELIEREGDQDIKISDKLVNHKFAQRMVDSSGQSPQTQDNCSINSDEQIYDSDYD